MVRMIGERGRPDWQRVPTRARENRETTEHDTRASSSDDMLDAWWRASSDKPPVSAEDT